MADRFIPCFAGGHIPARVFILTCEKCGRTYCRRHPCTHTSAFKCEPTKGRADGLMAQIDLLNSAGVQ